MFIFYNPVLHFLSGPYQDVTQNTHGLRPQGLQADRHRPARAAPRAAEGLALRRARARRCRSSCGRSGASSCPGCTRTSAATRSGSSSAVDRAVPRWAASWPGSRSARRSSSCSASAATRLRPLIDANKYLTLVMLMFAAFGFAFEFPLLLVFLLLVGVVNTRQLRNVRRWAAVGHHHLRGRHHPQPGSVLPILHGRPHVHLLRGRDPDRAVDEAMSPARSKRQRRSRTGASRAEIVTAVGVGGRDRRRAPRC